MNRENPCFKFSLIVTGSSITNQSSRKSTAFPRSRETLGTRLKGSQHGVLKGNRIIVYLGNFGLSNYQLTEIAMLTLRAVALRPRVFLFFVTKGYRSER